MRPQLVLIALTGLANVVSVSGQNGNSALFSFLSEVQSAVSEVNSFDAAQPTPSASAVTPVAANPTTAVAAASSAAAAASQSAASAAAAASQSAASVSATAAAAASSASASGAAAASSASASAAAAASSASASAAAAASSARASGAAAASSAKASATGAAASVSNGLSEAALIGTIVGCIVGGILLLLILICCCAFCLRRHHRRRTANPVANDEEIDGWRGDRGTNEMTQEPTVPLINNTTTYENRPATSEHPAFRSDTAGPENPFVPQAPPSRKPVNNHRALEVGGAAAALGAGEYAHHHHQQQDGHTRDPYAEDGYHNASNGYGNQVANPSDTSNLPVRNDENRPPTPFGLNAPTSNNSSAPFSSHDHHGLEAGAVGAGLGAAAAEHHHHNREQNQVSPQHNIGGARYSHPHSNRGAVEPYATPYQSSYDPYRYGGDSSSGSSFNGNSALGTGNARNSNHGFGAAGTGAALGTGSARNSNHGFGAGGTGPALGTGSARNSHHGLEAAGAGAALGTAAAIHHHHNHRREKSQPPAINTAVGSAHPDRNVATSPTGYIGEPYNTPHLETLDSEPPSDLMRRSLHQRERRFSSGAPEVPNRSPHRRSGSGSATGWHDSAYATNSQSSNSEEWRSGQPGGIVPPPVPWDDGYSGQRRYSGERRGSESPRRSSGSPRMSYGANGSPQQSYSGAPGMSPKVRTNEDGTPRRLRFSDLGEPDHAYEHSQGVGEAM